jgi:hypothetical protein
MLEILIDLQVDLEGVWRASGTGTEKQRGSLSMEPSFYWKKAKSFTLRLRRGQKKK